MEDHSLTINAKAHQILIVEDEDQLRSMLRNILEEAGYVVREAVDGDGALKSYARAPADLVVTDIVMPGSEGIETIMKFKRGSPVPKILAMSGGGQKGGQDYLHLAKKLGADRTIAKPFTITQILKTIEEMLR